MSPSEAHPARRQTYRWLSLVVVGLVLGMGAGVGIVALREFADDRIYQVETLIRATSFPVLVGIPEIVTASDKRRRWVKRLAQATGAIGIIYAGGIVLHHYVMDLNVFWAKLIQKFGDYIPYDFLNNILNLKLS